MTMSFPLNPNVAASRILSGPAGQTDASAAPSWWRIVHAWAGRRRQRAALAKLDDRLLADIGITRFEAAHEAAKPFWR